jgi:hypothetical protein
MTTITNATAVCLDCGVELNEANRSPDSEFRELCENCWWYNYQIPRELAIRKALLANDGKIKKCQYCDKETKQLFDEPGCSGVYAMQICQQCYEKRVDSKLAFRNMMSEIIEECEQRDEVRKWVRERSNSSSSGSGGGAPTARESRAWGDNQK